MNRYFDTDKKLLLSLFLLSLFEVLLLLLLLFGGI
jgi:hypothetical protein